MTSYRYPNEHFILALSLFLVLVVIAVSAIATLFASLIFVVAAVVWAYTGSRQHHQALISQGYPVSPQTQPELDALVRRCAERVRPGPTAVFVTRSRDLNAYTFGLEDPKVIVLYSSLFQIMDADELAFIIGHEMGHVALGHTWLNSLVGGLAGIPSPSFISALLHFVFLSWNRACELSSDRAGLLACGSPEKAITSLVKLVAGPAGVTPAGLERAYRAIDAEDDTLLGSLNEALGTHPMLIRRINELRRWANSAEYRRLSGQIR